MDLNDPRNPILKVLERDYGEKPEKGVVFGDIDLDRGLLGSKQRNILEKHKLQLPSKLMKKNSKSLNYIKIMLKYIWIISEVY